MIKLGSYELLIRLASGGGANVFLARDPKPPRPRLVALKVLLPQLMTNLDAVRAFFTEARIAARLRHRHIVGITGFGETDGVYGLAMDYVFGSSLAQLLNTCNTVRKPLSVCVILEVVAQVCDALHYAHEQTDEAGRAMHLVHRDVSPENILVGFDGVAKLTDFGIAKVVGRGWETQAGIIKGKSRYMSPEQLMARTLDRRHDIFQLGVVLWESLTGRRLFTGATIVEIFEEIARKPIKPPSEASPGLPPVTDPIVMKALERRPEDRYQTAAEMRADIEALLERAEVNIATAAIGADLRGVFGPIVDTRARHLRAAVGGDADLAALAEAMGGELLDPGLVSAPPRAGAGAGSMARLIREPSRMLLGDAAAPDQLGMPARTEVVLLDLEPSPSSTRKLPSFAEPPRNGSAGRRSSGIQKLAAAPDSGESDQTLPPPSNRPAQADLHDDSLRTSLDTPLSEALMRDLAPQPQSWARSKAPARNGAGSAVPTTPSSTAGVGNASRLAPPLHQDEGETIDASDASAAMVLEARAVARGMQLAGGAIPAEVPATPNDTWADLIPPLPRNVGDELRGIHDTPVDAGRLRGWNELQTFEDCTVPLFLDTNPAAGASASERDTVPPFRPQPPQAAQEPIAARGRAEADHATVRDTRMPSIAQRMPVPDSGDDERFEPIGKPQRADGILRRVEPRGTPSPDRTERLDPPPHDLHDDAAESSTRRNLPRPTHEEATTDPHPHQGRGMWLPHHVVLLAIAAAFLAGMITGLIVSAML